MVSSEPIELSLPPCQIVYDHGTALVFKVTCLYDRFYSHTFPSTVYHSSSGNFPTLSLDVIRSCRSIIYFKITNCTVQLQSHYEPSDVCI
jgi:hypothetical protein